MNVQMPGITIALLALLDAASASDFPQWRGAERSGVVTDSPPLAESWGREGPPMKWESEVFPQRAGQGSPVIASGRAYLFINWPFERELTERRVDDSALGKLHWFDPETMPAKLLASMEKARATLPPKLRGRELDEWTKAWIEENVSESDGRWRGTISRRFRDGPDAIPIDALKKLGALRNREFADERALEAWLAENAIEGEVRDRLIGAIPTSVTFARDVLLCVSLADGTTLWKYSVDGRRDDAKGSSTPCVHSGRVYFLGTTHAHCVDAVSGERIWATELTRGGSPSSFVIDENRAIVVARHLIAFDRQSGSRLWEQEKVRGGNSSPAIWKHDDESRVLVNGDGGTFSCVDAESGEIVWTVKGGGGDSSPVVSGDIAVLHTNDRGPGLVAYKLGKETVRPLWTIPRKGGHGASTPIVTGDTVWLLGGDEALCVSLRDGEVRWKQDARVEISSPILADGKILSVASSGRQLLVLRAGGTKVEELSKTRLSAVRCASPALSDGRLIVRLNDRLACFDLRK